MPIPWAAIATTVAKAAGSFLGSLGSGAGQAAGSAIGNSVFSNLNSGITRVRREDVDHNQNMADLINPREIRRQGEFLSGIAPYQADAYNTYQDQTFSADTARQGERISTLMPIQAQADLDYQNTVYAGTSPWERLGSNASPSLQAPSPTRGGPDAAPDGAAIMSQFLPLITAQIQADTAKSTAMINATSQQNVAKTQQETALKTTGIQTADGALPTNQAAQAAAQTLLTEAQKSNVEASTEKTSAETEKVRQETSISAAAAMLDAMPSETIDLGIIKWQGKPGWRQILPILTSPNGAGNRRNEIEKAMKSLPADSWSQVHKDMLEMASLFVKGTGAAVQGVSNVRNFLRHLTPKG